MKKVFTVNTRTKTCMTKSGGERIYNLEAKSNLKTSVKTRRCQTHLLQVGLWNKISFEWINWEIQSSDCSLGFYQQYGLNYDKMFSQVANTTISPTSTLWQMDMNNDFLHKELDLEIYMNQPKGFENGVWVISQYIQSTKKSRLDVARQSTMILCIKESKTTS